MTKVRWTELVACMYGMRNAYISFVKPQETTTYRSYDITYTKYVLQ